MKPKLDNFQSGGWALLTFTMFIIIDYPHFHVQLEILRMTEKKLMYADTLPN